MDWVSTKMQQLERALLEMGSEVYRLKGEVTEVKDHQQKLVKTIQSLKQLFDDKGLVSADEFDHALDMTEIMNQVNNTADPIQTVFERLKKLGH